MGHRNPVMIGRSSHTIRHQLNEVNRGATLKPDVLTRTSLGKVSIGLQCASASITKHTLPRRPVFLQLSQPLDFFLHFVSFILRAIFSITYLAQLSRCFHHFTAVVECLCYTFQLLKSPLHNHKSNRHQYINIPES
jgi:hypothetical protein